MKSQSTSPKTSRKTRASANSKNCRELFSDLFTKKTYLRYFTHLNLITAPDGIIIFTIRPLVRQITAEEAASKCQTGLTGGRDGNHRWMSDGEEERTDTSRLPIP